MYKLLPAIKLNFIALELYWLCLLSILISKGFKMQYISDDPDNTNFVNPFYYTDNLQLDKMHIDSIIINLLLRITALKIYLHLLKYFFMESIVIKTVSYWSNGLLFQSSQVTNIIMNEYQVTLLCLYVGLF